MFSIKFIPWCVSLMCNSDLQRKVRWNLSVAVCFRVGLTRISSQFPVSDVGEWRHICHFFLWQTMWRVTFVTFLGRMWRSRTRNFFFELVTFLGRNVTIQLGLKHSYLFPSLICHLSRKREAGRTFNLRQCVPACYSVVQCVTVCCRVL